MLHKLFQIFINELESDSTVKGYVKDRVYPQRIAEIRSVEFPCITFYIVMPVRVGGALSTESRFMFEIRTHAETLKEAAQIYSAMKSALAIKNFRNTNYHIVTGGMPDTPRHTIDPDSEPITYNCYCTFEVFALRRT